MISIMDPGVEIPEEAAAIHGWTNERLREEPEALPPEEVLPLNVLVVEEWLEAGWPVVVFNARYDLTLFNAELARIGEKPIEWQRVIDPLVIDKEIDTYRPGKRTLTDLCLHYRVSLEGAHDAGFDAIAAARLAWRMGHDIPSLGAIDLDDLHALQVEWARRSAQSFKTFLAVTYGETDRRVPEGWPVELSPDDDVELVVPDRPRLPPNWDDGGYGGYQ